MGGHPHPSSFVCRAVRFIAPLKEINALSPRNPRSTAEAVKVNFNPSGPMIVPLAVMLVLFNSGFQLVSTDLKSLYLLPCPVGTFSNSSFKGLKGCTQCPPGILQPSLHHVSIFFLQLTIMIIGLSVVQFGL